MGAYSDLTWIMQQSFLKPGAPEVTCEQFVDSVRDSAARMYRYARMLLTLKVLSCVI